MPHKQPLNKYYWILVTTYTILFITDYLTTITLPHYQILETNAAYQATGSMLIPLAANIILLLINHHIQRSSRWNQTWKYTAILMLVSITLFRLTAIDIALDWHQNPPTLEEAKAVATPQNLKVAQQQAALSIYVPAFVGLIAFLFWWKTHKENIKTKKEKKIGLSPLVS